MENTQNFKWRQYLVYWFIRGIGVVTFQTPTPKFYNFSQDVTYDFARYIANIRDIPAIFLFCRVFGVIYNMQILFYGNALLSNCPMDQTLKICVKEMWKKMRQSCLYW